MKVKVERTSPVSWNILEQVIPPGYIIFLKKECISEKRITVYTAMEKEEDALGYLILTPVHYRRTMYEIAHMQVVLEETHKHIGTKLIDFVVEDLKKNKMKSLCAFYNAEDDDEGILASFFKANGFEHKATYISQRYSLQQTLDSKIRKRQYDMPIKSYFKSYDELRGFMKDDLIHKKKVVINASNKDCLHFLMIDNQVAAVCGIYRMKDRMILDDIYAFNHEILREIVLFIWSYFVDVVSNTYKKENFHTVEIVVPDLKYEIISLKLIGEPISKTIMNKMILNLQQN